MFKFLRLREADLPMVLAWRTNPRVARYMLTWVDLDMEAQRRWFRGLKDRYWVIHTDEKPIGVINLAGPDTFGFYIGEDDAVPLGGLVLPYFYNHVFKRRSRIFADVMHGNEGMKRLHQFHGFRMMGEHPSVTEYMLERDAWEAQAIRYGHMTAEFE